MPEITPQQIIDAALAPSSTTTDGLTVSERSVSELIEADKYARANAALAGTNANGGSRSGWGTLRPARVVPPGAN